MSVGMQASLKTTLGASNINGQTMAVQNIFEQARIIEISFVPTGADPHTSAAQFSAKPLTPVSQPATMRGVIMTEVYLWFVQEQRVRGVILASHIYQN